MYLNALYFKKNCDLSRLIVAVWYSVSCLFDFLCFL